MTATTRRPAAATPSKALLCLHGAGSSANIFRIQLAKFRLALKHEFDFVFANGPHLSSAGPGILPLFAGAGPYYSWFREEEATMDDRMAKINAAVRATVEEWEWVKTNPQSRIVGVIAFSEGALAATLLLWQQQMGQVTWLPTLHFATLMCCYFRDEATVHMRADAETHGSGRPLINVPTLHMHGRQDFCLSRARKLVTIHYSPDFAEVMEFEGGHHCPTRREDFEEATKHILRLAHITIK